MKTKNEIMHDVQDIFCDSNVEVEIRNFDVLVKVTQEYYSPEHGLSMSEFVHKMCEAVGLEEMEEYDTINEPGCETCDYGSSYGTQWRFFTPKNLS
jgi:hypothetical protein